MRNPVLVFVFALCAAMASAQESLYSFSSGIVWSHGEVDLLESGNRPNTTQGIDATMIPLQYAFWGGSREFGGILLVVDTELPTALTSFSSTSDPVVEVAYSSKLSLGYEFYKRVSLQWAWRMGPVVSLVMNSGSARHSDGSQAYISSYQPMVGVDGEGEFFPFDTGWGIIDGLHLLAGASIEVGVPSFRAYQLAPRLGLGFVL